MWNAYHATEHFDWADAALRNSRARLLHQIMRRPGRGGLTAQGAEQLRQYFSKKATEAGKLTLGEMDESARMVMLQMAAEEIDSEGLSYGELRDVAEKRMAKRAEGERGGDDGKERVEKDVGTGFVAEAEGRLGEEEAVGSGVALANEFDLCIRSKEEGGATLDHDL